MLTALNSGSIAVRPKLLRGAIFHILILLIRFQIVLAVPLGTQPVSFTQRLWQMQDGLPEQVVQAFAQTADRYLWIGTTGGLVRFDGERFLTFNRENTSAFSENNVFCLLVAHDATLGSEWRGAG